MVPKRSRSYAPESCATCHGTGRGLASNSPTCPACYGKGSVLVAQPSQQCAKCNGVGFDSSGATPVCLVCDGTGWTDTRQEDF